MGALTPPHPPRPGINLVAEHRRLRGVRAVRFERKFVYRRWTLAIAILVTIYAIAFIRG